MLAEERRIGDWSLRLGLASTPLFYDDQTPQHFALLDGVEGSFALSTTEGDIGKFLDWSWSAQLATHVSLAPGEVTVRQVEPGARTLRFDTAQVDRNLEKFLDTMIANRVAPAMNVSEHLVTCFRSHRHTAASSGMDDREALATFLTMLEQYADEGSIRADSRLPPDHGERFQEELRYNRLTQRTIELPLTLRHAAGMVFQETHAELTSAPVQQELFGLATFPRRPTRNRLGAYYTPPGLARVLSDITVSRYLDKPSITILDPACGSGTFLIEALNSLARHQYKGAVNLVGFDISESAIEMAQFALRYASRGRKNVRTTVQVGDFLQLPDGAADIVLMNPPFLAYQDWSVDQVTRAKAILGESFGYRPDLSMLFITKALDCLRPMGTVASLLPSGVLQQTNGREWRHKVVEGNSAELIAVLGDHGLFKDAMVNIAALVVRKSTAQITVPTMLWASQRRGASAAALRRLRRWTEGDHRPERNSDWAIYPAQSELESQDWTPRPNNLGDLPARLAKRPGIRRVSDFFHVELGVRAGNQGKWLQIPADAYASLPKQERPYFRPVAETKSIRRGSILPSTYVFFPPEPMTVEAVARAAPRYFQAWLSQRGLSPDTLLELERPRRATNDTVTPKIVSRAFIGPESFAFDPEGRHVVVQGYTWLPKPTVTQAASELAELLESYCLLLNSRLFFALLRESARIVGGGQVDGAKRHMQNVPLPDLSRLFFELPELRELSRQLRERSRYPETGELDAFAAKSYQTSLAEWSTPE